MHENPIYRIFAEVFGLFVFGREINCHENAILIVGFKCTFMGLLIRCWEKLENDLIGFFFEEDLNGQRPWKSGTYFI